MINVAQSRAALDALKSDLVAVPREQLDVLLTACEVGQHAQRTIDRLTKRGLISPSMMAAAA